MASKFYDATKEFAPFTKSKVAPVRHPNKNADTKHPVTGK
jgi:hypothetical protein